MRKFRSTLLHASRLLVIPATLTVGDYIIMPDICVERKSVPTLIRTAFNNVPRGRDNDFVHEICVDPWISGSVSTSAFCVTEGHKHGDNCKWNGGGNGETDNFGESLHTVAAASY